MGSAGKPAGPILHSTNRIKIMKNTKKTAKKEEPAVETKAEAVKEIHAPGLITPSMACAALDPASVELTGDDKAAE